MKKYTRLEIAEYILGCSLSGQDWYTVDQIEGILGNAKAMLRDDQDGIEAVYERRKDRDF